MDANTPHDADAAELAALYRRAEDAGKAFAAQMDAAMPMWAAIQDARATRDAFKRDFKAKHMGMKLTNKEPENG